MKKLFIAFLFLSTGVFAQKKITVNAGSSGSSASTVLSLKAQNIASDANLSMYSSTFGTDQTAAIQTILNSASATNPLHIYWDVKASVTGLRIKSNTTIEVAPGCGAILRDSSNTWLLSNYNQTAQLNAIVDSNITIIGGEWNANGYRDSIGKQLNSDSTHGEITGLCWWGVKGMKMLNMHVMNARKWCVATMAMENFLVDGCYIDQGPRAGYNMDGITMQGMGKNITIINTKIRAGDDRIALAPNSSGGVWAPGPETFNHYAYIGVNGDMNHVRIENIIFEGPGKGIAIYNAGANSLTDLFVSNISGTAQSYWCGIFNGDMITNYGSVSTGTNWPKGLRFENINVEVYGYIGYGSTGDPMCIINCSVEDLFFKNVKRTNWAIDQPSFGVRTVSTPVLVKNLVIDGYNSINTAPASYAHHINVATGTVTNLSILNANVDIGTESTDRSLLYNASTITNVFLINVRQNYQRRVVNNQGTIGTLNMSGVIHTNQSTTDATVSSAGTMTKLVVSNWSGKLLSAGTIGSISGDALYMNGTAAPAITPQAINMYFLDTTNKKLYIATGTASSADWTILN